VRLLLIADTHVPIRARDLLSRVWDEVADVDVAPTNDGQAGEKRPTRPRGDRWIAATGIGDTNTKPQPRQPVPGGKVSEHRPRFQVGVDPWYQLGCAEVLRCGDRTRQQGVQMVVHPKRVDALATAVRQFARTKAVGE
jgi:hypothetical protein